MDGWIHSWETCGAVDGPGLRFVVFLQGCPLRCLYCQNPDCRHREDGRRMSVEAVLSEARKYRSYMQASGGGITLSGGEPLAQPRFAAELLGRCRAEGIHTALDTSGYCELTLARPVLDVSDLVLLDIKSFDPLTYQRLTGVALEPTLRLARYLDRAGTPVWIRFVLVPGITDGEANLVGLADFLATLGNVERVEVLPFHKLGEHKWEQLGYDYQLRAVPAPSPAMVQRAIDIFSRRGLAAV